MYKSSQTTGTLPFQTSIFPNWVDKPKESKAIKIQVPQVQVPRVSIAKTGISAMFFTKLRYKEPLFSLFKKPIKEKIY